jgi:hypothetical protein
VVARQTSNVYGILSDDGRQQEDTTPISCREGARTVIQKFKLVIWQRFLGDRVVDI